jgi:hypothetical protein
VSAVFWTPKILSLNQQRSLDPLDICVISRPFAPAPTPAHGFPPPPSLLETPTPSENTTSSPLAPPPICSVLHSSQPFTSTARRLRVLATLPSPLSPIVLDAGFMLRFTITKVYAALVRVIPLHAEFVN